MSKVPLRNDEHVWWDTYYDGAAIVYEAVHERDNKEAKPREHGRTQKTKSGTLPD
jgi:hypothetical protein